MAIKLITIKCPECHALLDAEEGRKQLYCSYCGAKILIDNDNEFYIHHIDDAKIKTAEAQTKTAEAQIKTAEFQKQLRMKKLEIIEKRRAEKSRNKIIRVVVAIVLGIVGVFFFMSYGFDSFNSMIGMLLLLIALSIVVIGNENDANTDIEVELGDKVIVPKSVFDYERKQYAAIEAAFKGAGFNNIVSVPLYDLSLGVLYKPGMVEKITIDGEKIDQTKIKFTPNVPVVISYHSNRKGV